MGKMVHSLYSAQLAVKLFDQLQIKWATCAHMTRIAARSRKQTDLVDGQPPVLLFAQTTNVAALKLDTLLTSLGCFVPRVRQKQQSLANELID